MGHNGVIKMDTKDIKVCVLRIEGTNCEDETNEAFRMLGASAETIHLKQLTSDVSPAMRRRLEEIGRAHV